MWLQFAPYVKSKTRLFLKSHIFVFVPPNLASVVDHSSQGRFSFFPFLRHIVQNGHNWSTKAISGPDFLKNDDIWSDLVRFEICELLMWNMVGLLCFACVVCLAIYDDFGEYDVKHKTEKRPCEECTTATSELGKKDKI